MSMMSALVYEAPRQMPVRQVALPSLQAGDVLIRVAYSGICGSELSGFLGQNALRKPPLIMGHEFSGHIAELSPEAEAGYPELRLGQAVTANPLVTCGRCRYCLQGRQPLCPSRRLISAALPGSNAQYVAVPAGNIFPLPAHLSLTDGALAEPVACAVHTVAMAAPTPNEVALVVGLGPIGLFLIEALRDHGVRTIYSADTNAERQAMGESLGSIAVDLRDPALARSVDIAIDAVGLPVTRQGCVAATRPGGRVYWVGLHEAGSDLPVNDLIRFEISTFGSFGYTPLDFGAAITALGQGRYHLQPAWTRVEPLASGAACFEELLDGANVAKIWLTPNGDAKQ